MDPSQACGPQGGPGACKSSPTDPDPQIREHGVPASERSLLAGPTLGGSRVPFIHPALCPGWLLTHNLQKEVMLQIFLGEKQLPKHDWQL